MTNVLGNKTASRILLVVGIGLLLASLLADVIGIGDNVGFGRQQMMGTAAGAIVAAIGLFLVLKGKRPLPDLVRISERASFPLMCLLSGG